MIDDDDFNCAHGQVSLLDSLKTSFFLYTQKNESKQFFNLSLLLKSIDDGLHYAHSLLSVHSSYNFIIQHK